ncbi:ROK family protein [Paenactinomyces guangxiensis]|uniref:ROK family protein n=1 Tax=Paenactinomyces guangxiensis TaxID=1490290 RepID=A0A7W1WRE1_9BACL|nr:ROK family protein [Paenactinomyces guangxiensis]MBA4494680.1 ROK family protein [Paenactinomyces guangxiensis]MBH8591764.1 ROK family protein [Paenactinomyces guangxiensis]
MDFVVGVDLGGTNIVTGLLDREGNLKRTCKLPTEAHLGSSYVIEKIGKIIQSLLAEEQIDKSRVLAAGVGNPGFVDPVRGVSLFSANLGWKDVPVADKLRQQLEIPVFLDNDVRMYALGEALQGAGKGHDVVLGITLGTGIAAAIVDRGKLFYGGGYMAGEIGHIPMEGESTPCPCGVRGCLETVASATGIIRQVRAAIEGGRSSILQTWFESEDLSRITAADVTRAYDAGDPVAIEVLSHTGRLLGKGLSYAVSLLSPDAIVIGGGVAFAGERLFAPMKEELEHSVYHGYWERISIRTAELLDDAGVIGSALYAKQRMES